MQELGDKKIIITGAASGIGKATVKKCISNGATVFALDIDRKGLERLYKELNSEKLHILRVDVSKYKEIEEVYKIILEKNGHPDSLINNAGIYFGKSILDYSEYEIERVFSINIKSAVLFSQLFARELLRNRKSGIIINISSVSGQEGSSDAIYGLSKAALLGLTKSNAINFAPFIRVNAIAPGIIETPMIQKIPKKRIKNYKEQELIKESINPEDVAETVIFLLSDNAKHYTGSVFDLNNGCYLR